MHCINSLFDAPIGSVVQFNYMGGSRYGALRKVEVTSHTVNGIIGKDFDRGGEFRSFNVSAARNARVVSDAPAPKAATRLTTVRIHFSDARSELRAVVDRLTGEELADVFSAHRGGINPAFDKASGCVQFDVPAKTFMVNGQEMTVAELAALVQRESA